MPDETGAKIAVTGENSSAREAIELAAAPAKELGAGGNGGAYGGGSGGGGAALDGVGNGGASGNGGNGIAIIVTTISQ